MRPMGYKTPPRRMRQARYTPQNAHRCVADPMTGFAGEPLRDEDMQRAAYGRVIDIKENHDRLT